MYLSIVFGSAVELINGMKNKTGRLHHRRWKNSTLPANSEYCGGLDGPTVLRRLHNLLSTSLILYTKKKLDSNY